MSGFHPDAPSNLRREAEILHEGAVHAQLSGRMAQSPEDVRRYGAAVADKVAQQQTLKDMSQSYAIPADRRGVRGRFNAVRRKGWD